MYTLASLLCAVAADAGQLIAFRGVQGLAGAAGIVIARAVVRDLHTGTALARFFALTMLVNGLAPILAPIIGGQLLLVTSWRGIFVVLAAIGAVLFVAVLLRLRESLPPERRRTGGLGELGRTFRLLLTDRPFVGYALASALSFTAMFSYISSSPFVLQDLFGLSPQAFSLAFAVNAIGIVIMGQVSGALVGRVTPRRLMTAGLCLQVAGRRGAGHGRGGRRGPAGHPRWATSWSRHRWASCCPTPRPSRSPTTPPTRAPRPRSWVPRPTWWAPSWRRSRASAVRRAPCRRPWSSRPPRSAGLATLLVLTEPGRGGLARA